MWLIITSGYYLIYPALSAELRYNLLEIILWLLSHKESSCQDLTTRFDLVRKTGFKMTPINLSPHLPLSLLIALTASSLTRWQTFTTRPLHQLDTVLTSATKTWLSSFSTRSKKVTITSSSLKSCCQLSSVPDPTNCPKGNCSEWPVFKQSLNLSILSLPKPLNQSGFRGGLLILTAFLIFDPGFLKSKD